MNKKPTRGYEKPQIMTLSAEEIIKSVGPAQAYGALVPGFTPVD